jgi:hypothetical protein
MNPWLNIYGISLRKKQMNLGQVTNFTYSLDDPESVHICIITFRPASGFDVR